VDRGVLELVVDEQSEQESEGADAEADHEQRAAVDATEEGGLPEVGQDEFGLAAGGGRSLGEGVSRRDEAHQERESERSQPGAGVVRRARGG